MQSTHNNEASDFRRRLDGNGQKVAELFYPAKIS